MEDFRASNDHVATGKGTFSDCEILDSVPGRVEEYEDEASGNNNKPIVSPTVATYWAALKDVIHALCNLHIYY